MKLILKSPLKYWEVNQYFGLNSVSFYAEDGLRGHNGIDYHAPDSTPIYASHDGRVTFTGYDGAGGLGVVIRTTEQFEYKDGQSYFKTLYWHLKKDTIKVTGGQTVKAGDLIAFADNTGRSTGSHLHFGLKPIYQGEQEWIWDNIENDNGYRGAIDPLPYFEPRLTLTRLLRFNTKGDDVKQLQGLLNSSGFKLVPDGEFGAKTERVVKSFQEKNGLKIDGIVGKNTLAFLNKF